MCMSSSKRDAGSPSHLILNSSKSSQKSLSISHEAQVTDNSLRGYKSVSNLYTYFLSNVCFVTLQTLPHTRMGELNFFPRRNKDSRAEEWNRKFGPSLPGHWELLRLHEEVARAESVTGNLSPAGLLDDTQQEWFFGQSTEVWRVLSHSSAWKQ